MLQLPSIGEAKVPVGAHGFKQRAPLASALRCRVEPEPPRTSAGRSPDGLFTSADWLRAHGRLVGGRLSHLTVRDDASGAVRAAAPLLLDGDGRGISFQPEPYFPAAAARTPSRWARFALSAGLGAAYHSSLWISPAGGATGAAAGATLLDGLEDCAHERGAAYVAVLFAPAGVAGALTALGRPTTNRLLPIGHASIALTGDRLEHHLASLSQKGAQNVRREMQAARREGLRIERLPLAGRPAGIELLAEEVEIRYRSRVRAEEVRAELSAFADAFGDRAMLFVGSYDGEPAGFTLAVQHGGTLYMRRVGLAYGRLRGAFEYFNLGYYAPLEYCYEQGLSRLHLGCGAADAKLLRGASIAPLFHVLLGVSDPDGGSGDALAFWQDRRARRPGAFPERAWKAAFELAGGAARP